MHLRGENNFSECPGMKADFSYDPVTAIDEASATGEVEEIFADIRQTMRIPLVTSIWRGLAGMGDSLETVWRATKPIYASGLPEQSLARIVEQTDLPMPEPLVAAQLVRAGINDEQLRAIKTIVDAYTRSNGLNMVALYALISPQVGQRETLQPSAHPVWGDFPPLPAKQALDANTWQLIRHANALGAPGDNASVATLWRHLGHWPNLLSLIYSGLAPRHAAGAITGAAHQMVELTRLEASNLAAWREDAPALSEQARQTVTGYVTTPWQVVRMVVLGHTLARWLPSA
jgi:hypothetical protein